MEEGIFRGRKIQFSQDYLNLKQSKQIQALACIGIMIHHVTQQITSYGNNPKGPITVFSYIGFMFTALFFFFSGYGLLYSYRWKKDYFDGFLKKRLPSVLIPFWITNILIIIVQKFLGTDNSDFLSTVKDIVGVTLVNSNGWFVIEIVILYLLFYVIFSVLKNKDLAAALLCITTVLLMVYSLFQGHDPYTNKVHWFRGEWWYNSTICFCYGVLYANYKEKIERSFRSFYYIWTLIAGLLTLLMICASIYTLNNYGYYRELVHDGLRSASITLSVQSVSCIVFTTFVLLLNMRFPLKSRILEYLGSILLPLFLVHGYVVNTLSHDIRVSDLLRYVIIIGVSIGLAAVIAPISGFAVKLVKELLNNSFGTNLKKVAIILALMCGLAVIAIPVIHSVVISKEFSEECAVFKDAQVGDVVKFGHYNTRINNPGKERLTWEVVKRQDDRLCLMCEYGIAGSYYNQHHQEITWEDSDIRKLINSKEFTGSFSGKEADIILQNDGDMLTLLTPEEAEDFFENDEARQIAITDVAARNGVNINTPSKVNNWDMKGYRSSWWWLRGENTTPCITAPIVTVDGTIVMDEKVVNKPGGAIRPVVWILLR
ncbi:acyltransferase family protein [Butyrivibrio sp.]|uniref:acyltransferase family protein n=1 Tax=Butyrivibrio sp. TaxID=28121 RepID=UPI0025C39196|nr:acyltransferase family protein [Butyrivibrio sp.]